MNTKLIWPIYEFSVNNGTCLYRKNNWLNSNDRNILLSLFNPWSFPFPGSELKGISWKIQFNFNIFMFHSLNLCPGSPVRSYYKRRFRISLSKNSKEIKEIAKCPHIENYWRNRSTNFPIPGNSRWSISICCSQVVLCCFSGYWLRTMYFICMYFI